MESKLNVTNLTSAFPCANASQSLAPDCIFSMMYPSQSGGPAPSVSGDFTPNKWVANSNAIRARPTRIVTSSSWRANKNSSIELVP